MEGLNPQVKRKILSDNPRRFYVVLSFIEKLRRFERLEQSTAVERFNEKLQAGIWNGLRSMSGPRTRA